MGINMQPVQVGLWTLPSLLWES